MNYLHTASQPILHLDLKTQNLLINDQEVTKVAGSLSTRLTSTPHAAHSRHASTRWQADADTVAVYVLAVREPDFGLSRVSSKMRTAASGPVGTPIYTCVPRRGASWR
jgi:serine/threonine protein kinase